MQHASLIPTERDFFTLEEFAKRTGIGMSTAYELANRDALPIPVVRVGRRFLLSRHAYQALLKREHGSTPVPSGALNRGDSQADAH